MRCHAALYRVHLQSSHTAVHSVDWRIEFPWKTPEKIRNTKPVTIVLRLTPNPPWKLQSHHNNTFTHTHSHFTQLTSDTIRYTALCAFNKTPCHQNESTFWKPHISVSAIQSHWILGCCSGTWCWQCWHQQHGRPRLRIMWLLESHVSSCAFTFTLYLHTSLPYKRKFKLKLINHKKC